MSAAAAIVEIEPKNKYLSAQELTTLRRAEAEPPRTGLKRTQNEGSNAEQEELRNAYANLRAQISVPRIDRIAGRAIAVWHVDQQAAEVVRKDGKFENFGYSAHGKLYLEYYEALFLLELGRLQLEYHDMIVSVEQAYLLLLGEMASEKYNKYSAYSALSRAGYIVVKHQNIAFDEIHLADESSIVTSEDCVWALFEHNVSNKPVPVHISASPLYAVIEANMNMIKQQIMGQSSSISSDLTDENESSAFGFDTRKRKTEPVNAVVNKKRCTKATAARSSLVDFLMSEAVYYKFQETFDKFDIVQLQSADHNINETECSLTISFDLHLHHEGFKKRAPKSPSFCVVILQANEPFPTLVEIAKCQRQQPHTAPLLVISVSESKQIQAFLYYIS